MSLRIAMWSGPRNISTALMRAWENRPDTVVWDEPLYAYYLYKTGLDHPGKNQIIAAGETDWRTVAHIACGPVPDNKAIFYQKYMAHHLLPEIHYDWLDEFVSAFLIRHPEAVLLSYVKTRQQVSLEEIGLKQQLRLFHHIEQRTGLTPVVIDTVDFLQQPEAYLRYLCERWQIDFSDSMLHWPPGPRDSDGVWAPYWYKAVQQSTGFAPLRQRTETLPGPLKSIAEQALPYYQALYEHRIVLTNPQ